MKLLKEPGKETAVSKPLLLNYKVTLSKFGLIKFNSSLDTIIILYLNTFEEIEILENKVI